MKHLASNLLTPSKKNTQQKIKGVSATKVVRMLIMVQGGEDLHYYFVKVAEKPSMEVWGRRTNTTILADVF
jgi:hypothetical protein